jgi:hypothetical protein
MFGAPFASPAQHFEGSQNYFFTQRPYAAPHSIGIHVTHRDFQPTFHFTAGTPAKPITLAIDSVHLNFTQTLPLGVDSFVVDVYAALPAEPTAPPCPNTAAAARYALRQTPWSLAEPQKLPHYTYQQYYQSQYLEGRPCAAAPDTLPPPTRRVTITLPLFLPTTDALVLELNTQLQTHQIHMQFQYDATTRYVSLARTEDAPAEHYRFQWAPSSSTHSFGRECLGATQASHDFPATAPDTTVQLPIEFPLIRDLFLALDDHGQSRSADLTSVAPSVQLHRDVIARISLQTYTSHDQVATTSNGFLHSDPRTFAPGADHNRPLTQLSCRFFDAFGNQVVPRSFTLSIRCTTL